MKKHKMVGENKMVKMPSELKNGRPERKKIES